jgi:hypothetical protein
MPPQVRATRTLVLGFALSPLFALPAFADTAVQNQVSVYSGDNAVGYLQPLANAFGAALNSSFGYSASIPKASFHISLEAPVAGVIFEDEDRTFNATPENGFTPNTAHSVPTVVGSGESVTVSGDGGAQFSFPGGLDLNSFGLVVPQLRIGAIKGTEALVRWIAFDQSDSDVGKIDVFGIGGRHSISQYMGEKPPVDLAVGAMWQTVKVGDNGQGGDFVSTDAFSLNLQASKRAPLGFLTFEPYAGVAWETFSADISYEDANGDLQDVSVDGENDMRFTIGAGFNFLIGHLWADYNFANTNNFSFGLALGNVGHAE